jgi:outer membrane protein OmpA-like peptidoglycan-associated protein
MRRIIALIAGFLLLGLIIALQLNGLYFGPGEKVPIQTSSVEPPQQRTDPPARVEVASPKQASLRKNVALDIARISQTGPSVFAGRAAPFAHVVVLDGATVIGTASANSNGEWSMVTEYRFATLDPRINFQLADGQKKITAVPPPEAPRSHSRSTKLAAPGARLLNQFEHIVAAAREEAKRPDDVVPPVNSKKAPQDVTSTTVAEIPVKSTRNDATAATQPSLSGPATTPIPMTFIYNEATLTDDGRRAANLLLEYLKLKKFTAVTLTGHADERGLPNYNMELSRQRLLVIQQVLREGGYQGELNLLPKGSTEPYMGVDRSRYPYEELMQLDRRVELRDVH